MNNEPKIPLESLSEIFNNQINLIHTKDYTISTFRDNTIWLENIEGEGLEMGLPELNELLDIYFKKNL